MDEAADTEWSWRIGFLVLAILVQQSPRNRILNELVLGCWLGRCRALGIKIKQNAPA